MTAVVPFHLDPNEADDSFIDRKKPVRPPSCKSFHSFAEETSLHGVKYFVNPIHNKVRRFLWLVLFVAAVAFLVLVTVAHINQFLRYETTTSLRFVSESSIDFPALTICNYNPFRKSAVVDSGFEDVLPIVFPIFHRNSVSCPRAKPGYDDDAPSGGGNVTFPDMGVGDLGDLWGHRIEDMLLECRWMETYTCGPDDFKPMWSDLGPCFTFNALPDGEDASAASAYVVNKTSRTDGLWIRLNLEQEEYVSSPFNAAGIKILIHGRYDVATFLNPGVIDAAPGFVTVIPITKTRIMSKKAPYVTNCKDGGLKYYDTYTSNTCMIECVTDAVLDACGCFLPWARFGGTSNVCDLETTATCAIVVLDEVECSCDIPCVEERFNSRVSQAAVPAQYAIPLLGEKYNMTPDELRNNIVDLHFYFEDMRQTLIEHHAAFDFIDLTSALGGELGLMLGASLITLLEFLDYVIVYYLLGVSFLYKCYQQVARKLQK